MTCNRLILAGIISVLAVSIAMPAASQSGDAAYDHVVKVLAEKDNHLYIAVTGNFSSIHGCPSPWWAKSQGDFDNSQTKAMLQIALSSLLARTPVHVYTEGCDSGGSPIFTQIQIQEREPPPPTLPGPGTGCIPGAGERCCGDLVNGRCQGQCAAICP